MLSYLLRRFTTGLILLFLYISLLFVAIQVILPGDFVSHFASGLTPEQSQELRRSFGLDLPLVQRYFNWLNNLFHGDIGNSFTPFGIGPPVMEVIWNTLPITLFIFGIGTALAFMLGQWLGKVAAWRGPGLVTGSVTFGSIALYTSFPPWLAFLLVYYLIHKLNFPRTLGSASHLRGSITTEMGVATIYGRLLVHLIVASLIVILINYVLRRYLRRNLPTLVSLILVVGVWCSSWYLFGIQEEALEIVRFTWLPILVYTLLSFGEIMLIMRTSMVDTLHEDYIQTARAKGLPDHVVRDRHAARTALLPVMSRLVISLPFLLAGMAMLEEVLDIEGIGTALFYAIGTQNINLTMGAILFFGVISLLARLLLDLIQMLLDPRIRLSAK